MVVVVFLVICGILCFSAAVWQYSFGNATRKWKRTPGEIYASNIRKVEIRQGRSSSRIRVQYILDVTYQYTVGDETYTRNNMRFDDAGLVYDTWQEATRKAQHFHQ